MIDIVKAAKKLIDCVEFDMNGAGGKGGNGGLLSDTTLRAAHDLRVIISREAFSPAVQAIAAERRRQIEKEGWLPEHDDTHVNGELAQAAAAYTLGLYAVTGAVQSGKKFLPWAKTLWPWDLKWWKPKDREHDLVKAGALIVAELERLYRAASSTTRKGGAA